MLFPGRSHLSCFGCVRQGGKRLFPPLNHPFLFFKDEAQKTTGWMIDERIRLGQMLLQRADHCRLHDAIHTDQHFNRVPGSNQLLEQGV